MFIPTPQKNPHQKQKPTKNHTTPPPPKKTQHKQKNNNVGMYNRTKHLNGVCYETVPV